MQVIFYSVIIYLILFHYGQLEWSTAEFVKNFFPVITERYWFVSAYMILYIISPFINKLINTLTKQQYKTLLLILIFFLSVIHTFFPTNRTVNTYNGYNLGWFVIMYLIAGYIRIHFNKNIKNRTLVLITLLMISLNMGIRVANVKGVKILNGYVNDLIDYNSIIVLIQSIAVFLLFRNIKIDKQKINKIIYAISPLTFAVYLIHENIFFRSILWNKILNPTQYLVNYKIVFYMILDVGIIFITCCIIEKIRQMIFHIIGKTQFVKKIENRIENIKVEI